MLIANGGGDVVPFEQKAFGEMESPASAGLSSIELI